MSADVFVTGGPVPYNSPFYIVRNADHQAHLHLDRMEYIKLIEPRQQGKTSLIHRLAHTLGPGYVFAYVNAMRLDKRNEHFWYASLYRQLLPDLPFLTSSTRLECPTNSTTCGDFLTELAAQAEQAKCRVVIAIDELGDVWVDWRTGFFSNLRALFDLRLTHPSLKHLTFIFAGTYNDRALMNDPLTSPFNVAQRIPLTDFNVQQISQLVSHLQVSDEKATLLTHGIRYWTDGQPYLTQCVCRSLAEGRFPPTFAGVDGAALELYREDTNHLPRMLEQLAAERNQLLRAYVERVLNGHHPEFRPANDSRYHSPLALMGIIKADEQHNCKVRNRLYERAFRNAFLHSSLIEENTMPGFAEGYALVIGIAHYPKVRKLPKTVLKDASDIQALLRSPTHCGYHDVNVRLLLDDQATGDGIRAGLRWLAELAGTNATALIFFSGHGGRVEDDSHTSHYLIPYDCDPADLSGTGIPGEELTGLLREVKAQRLLACFDSCYAGGTGEAKGLSPEQPEFKSGLEETYYAQLARGAGRVIMASSRSDEVSLILPNMDNSLFTHHLLEALRGHASTHNDGLIRVFDVFHYVAERVPKQGPQHPIFKATDLENNFPVTLYLGGKRAEAVPDSVPQGGSVVDKRTLREVLVQRFTVEDLEVLCADIEQDLTDDGIEFPVNLDLVGGKGQQARVLNLMRYLENRGYLNYLVTEVRRRQPGTL